MPKKNEKRLEAILKAKEALGSIEAAKQASNFYKDFVSLRIAGAYILAKREQKGYTSKSIPDKEVDKKMLGLIKGENLFLLPEEKIDMRLQNDLSAML